MDKQYTFKEIWEILSDEEDETNLGLLIEGTTTLSFQIPAYLSHSDDFIGKLSDLLEEAGLCLNLDPDTVGDEIEQSSITDEVQGQDKSYKRDSGETLH